MSSAPQRTMRGGWAVWRWPPTIRGTSWSAIQHLVDARLDIGTVTEVGHVDAEAVGQRFEHLRGGVETDLLGLPPLWMARFRPRMFQRASSVTSAAVRPVTKNEWGCVDTYQLPTSRSIRGCGRVVNMYSGCHSPPISASSW